MTKKRIKITYFELMKKYAEIDEKYYVPCNSTAASTEIGGYTPEYLELMKQREESQGTQEA